MAKILILGATSAIAQAAARIWAQRGDSLFLVGRQTEKLNRVADDLKVRGAERVIIQTLDLNDLDQHYRIVQEADSSMGGVDVALIAFGDLGNQQNGQRDFAVCESILRTNFISPVSLLTHLSNLMETRKSGTVAVIGSVAGERGRQSNYIYGSAKGGLAIFLSGLRHRLASSGVKVITIKPGFVDTPMTAGFKKGLLWSSATRVGAGIVRAIDRRRDVVFLPWFWRPLMWVIRHIPERLFQRTRL